MNIDQIIRAIFNSHSIMNDISELNSLYRDLDDIKAEQSKVRKEIYDLEKYSPQGALPGLPLLNKQDHLDDTLKIKRNSKKQSRRKDKIVH